LPSDGTKETAIAFVKVVHLAPGKNRTWILGCMFVSALSDYEVNRLAALGGNAFVPLDLAASIADAASDPEVAELSEDEPEMAEIAEEEAQEPEVAEFAEEEAEELEVAEFAEELEVAEFAEDSVIIAEFADPDEDVILAELDEDQTPLHRRRKPIRKKRTR
jgi:Ran GTPase-activating protein (RanGAP) involved in mRNA processing and transport